MPGSLEPPLRRHVTHHLRVLADEADDWRTVDRHYDEGQLLRAWDLALQDDELAVSFTLAVRRYCAVRNLHADYAARVADDVP